MTEMTDKQRAEAAAQEKEKIFVEFPVLKMEEGFILRELQPLDSMDLLNYLSDKEVHKYINEEDTPATLKEAESEVHYWSSLFKHKRSVYWAVAREDTNQVIGTVGFNMWSRTHDRVEISYDLAHEYWGKGLMTSLLRLIIKYGFEEVNLKRIQATVVLSNKGSIRVLQKLGFKSEGVLAKYNYLRGKHCDSRMMALLDSDYKKDKAYASAGKWTPTVSKRKKK